MLNKQFYFSSPVEAVKVTNQNLAEVAEWCGGTVANTQSKKVPGKVDNYVWVPTPENDRLSDAFPGMWVIKRLSIDAKGTIRVTWSVFRKDYFSRNYHDVPIKAVDASWTKYYTQSNTEARRKGEKGDVMPPKPDRIDTANPAQEIDAAEVIEMTKALPKHFGTKTIEEVAAERLEADVEKAAKGMRGQTPVVGIVDEWTGSPADTEPLTVTTDDGEVEVAEEVMSTRTIEQGDIIIEVFTGTGKIKTVFVAGEDTEITEGLLQSLRAKGLIG